MISNHSLALEVVAVNVFGMNAAMSLCDLTFFNLIKPCKLHITKIAGGQLVLMEKFLVSTLVWLERNVFVF